MNKTAQTIRRRTMTKVYMDTTFFSTLTGKGVDAEFYYCSDSSSQYRWIKAWRISETEVTLQNEDDKWNMKTKKFESESETVAFLRANNFTFQERVKKETVPHIVEDDKGNMELLP